MQSYLFFIVLYIQIGVKSSRFEFKALIIYNKDNMFYKQFYQLKLKLKRT